MPHLVAMKKASFLAIRRLKADHPQAYRRYQGSGVRQALPPCPSYPDKLCPGECQYILSAAACIHDLGLPDDDLFQDLDALNAVVLCQSGTPLVAPTWERAKAVMTRLGITVPRGTMSDDIIHAASISRAEKLARAVLLFHRGGEWTAYDREMWIVLTGQHDATTKTLCDLAREVRGQEERA